MALFEWMQCKAIFITYLFKLLSELNLLLVAHTHTHTFLFELKYTFETVDQFDLRSIISVDLLLIDFQIHKNCIETILIEKKKTLAFINLDIDFMSVGHNLQLLEADFGYVWVNQFHKLYKLVSSNTYVQNIYFQRLLQSF